jgi:hypothetical protein
MPVLDGRLEMSLSWLRLGMRDTGMGDLSKTGCSTMWSRRVYELQPPNWHCVHSQEWSLIGWVVEPHAGAVEAKLVAVHGPKERREERECSW